jgi:hypothetical protein
MTTAEWKRMAGANLAFMRATALGCANRGTAFDSSRCEAARLEYWRVVDDVYASRMEESR